MKHKYWGYRDADIGNRVTKTHDIDNEYIEPLNPIKPNSLKFHIEPAIISSKYWIRMFCESFFHLWNVTWKHNAVAEPYVRVWTSAILGVQFYSYPIFLSYH